MAFSPAGTALVTLVALCIVLAPARLAAQTNTVSESRYLLIFDTSLAMKRRLDNIQRVAGDLISSGMNGQMRAGDTLGVWTFNETLHAGNLPLMRWTPDRRIALASRVTEFVRTQKFERVSSLVSVMPSVERVVTNSSKLTVLIFSDGVGKLSGTPYDVEINAAYEPFRENQKQERMPFVTVLRVKDRAYLGYAVTPSPWAVEFPKFPPDPVVVAPKVEPKPQPKPVVPPLIVIGKKDTNTAPAAQLPQPGTETRPEPPPGLTEAEKAFAKLAAEQGVALPAGFGEKSVAAATNPPPNQPAGGPTEQIKPLPAVETQKPAPSPSATTNAAAKSEATPAPASTSIRVEAKTNDSPLSASTTSPEVQAVVVPVDKHSSRMLLIAGGVSLLAVALGVVYALMRRRHRAHVSLITSSMDRRNR